MIRVLNIISDTNIGGAGRVLLNYLRYTDRERFETLVALPRGSLLGPVLEEAGGRVLEVDGIADRSFDRGDIKLLRELIRRERPGLVHTHGCFSGRIAARREGVPVIYSRHSAFPVPAKLRYPPGRWVNKLCRYGAAAPEVGHRPGGFHPGHSGPPGGLQGPHGHPPGPP